MYKIIDLIEPDNGCEGFMPGEEPQVTLILQSESGEKKTVRMPDALAYRLGWDVGSIISGEDVLKYCG